MPDTLEARIAHLEGSYEQIDKRLAGVESNLSQLRQEIREQFRWILGFQILTWISILGTLLAILFRR